MDQVKVYHKIESDFTAKIEKFNPADFELVATVETADLDVAFQLTNHIEGLWWENNWVTLIGQPKHRSSSVGDVFELNGDYHLVAPVGFFRMEVDNG